MSESAPIGGSVPQDGSARELRRQARRTSENLRHLAFHGHAEHVRALFETMTPAERERQANPDVLRQVVLGSLARLRALPSSAAVERQSGA